MNYSTLSLVLAFGIMPLAAVVLSGYIYVSITRQIRLLTTAGSSSSRPHASA